ncbi:hypothetical protein MTF64_03700 [Pseudoalteromonas sp. 2CM41L]|uniref:hypothetical protein n=1 Tax=Pseudoalteromonas sp. 2CM41L TaxID=2929857 RepID=UPI0020BF7D62|nr:hypothetical protein [Pseudoalteromonas sp. 2CM41L]MCK8105998.1 hypothetical protein [Pseudoalteromonas sp. 2CM41L]
MVEDAIELLPVWTLHGKAISNRWSNRISYQSSLIVEEFLESMKKSYNDNGKRFNKPVTKKCLSTILAHLIYASEHNLRVRYSRSTSHTKGKMNALTIIGVLDFLQIQSLVKQDIAHQNEHSNKQSTFWATDQFKELVKNTVKWSELAYTGPLVVIRDESKEMLPLPAQAKKVVTAVKILNTFLKCFEVVQDGKKQCIALRRVYRDSLELGGRFYTHGMLTYQNNKKTLRSAIKIDGEDTCELDYKAMHLNILHAWKKVQCKEDPYDIPGLDRDTVKRLVVRWVNSKPSDFKRVVTMSGKPEYKTEAGRAHLNPDARDSLIEDLPPGIKGEYAYSKLLEAYPDIASFIGQKNIGLQLQYTDSTIMSIILDELKLRMIPALPLHDSVIVKTSDAEVTEKVMLKAYQKVLNGFKISISRS